MTDKRSFSPVSIEGDANEPSILEVSKFSKEKTVFRPSRKDLTEDQYPSFPLKNVTIYKADGTTLGNLLNAELEGAYILRGLLVIEKPHEKLLAHLKSPKHNGEYIEARVHAFSIGENPTSLWAMGEDRWFEIHPAQAYEETYKHMIDGINIYFWVTVIYEQAGKGKLGKARLAALTIDDILTKLAFNEGTGLTLASIGEHVKSHAHFLLSQMRKGTIFKDSVIFQWLAGECEDIYNALRSKTGEEPVHFRQIHYAKPETPDYLRTPAPETLYQGAHLPVQPKFKGGKGKSINRQAKESPEGTSDTVSVKKSRSIFVTPSKPDMNALEAILWVIDACIKEGLKTPANITFGFVVQWLNYNLSLRSELQPRLSDHLFCKAIVTKYAGQVHSILPPQYANSPLARELLATVMSNAPLSNKGPEYNAKLSAEIDPILFNRRKANVRRISQDKTSRSLSNDDSPPDPSMRTPHASKSVPAIQSGRPSGKKSTLRIPSTTSKRAHDAIDIDRLSTKRHRTGSTPEVEMGPSSPSLSPTPSHSNSPSTSPPIPLPTTKHILTLHSDPLPTFAPTGPNGSYVCAHNNPTYNCPFVLRNPVPEDIRQHELFHLNILDKERLVHQEAHRGNFSATNLIARLKALGHAQQPVLQPGDPAVVLPVREAVHSRYAF